MLNMYFDPKKSRLNTFFCQKIVFIGKLKNVKKDVAVEYIRNSGGFILKNVSWNTSIVIFGEIKQETKIATKNLQKLDELINGAELDIRKMSEEEFLELSQLQGARIGDMPPEKR